MNTDPNPLVFTLISVGLAAALLVMAGCGKPCRVKSGRQEMPSKQEMMEQYDKDRDKRLSQAEFPGPDTHFFKLDVDSDGYLEMEELPDGPPDNRGGKGRR